MTIKNAMPVKAQAEPCFSLRKAYKFVQFPGSLQEFLQWLKDSRYLMHDLEPYKSPWEKGLFVYTYRRLSATNSVVCVTRVTIKGIYFLKKRLKNQQLKQHASTNATSTNA